MIKNKNLRKVIFEVLQKEKKIILEGDGGDEPKNSRLGSQTSDYLFYKGLTGNLLMIPKMAKPRDFFVINKEKIKSSYSTPQDLLDLYNNNSTVKACCDAIPKYKTMKPEDCAGLYLAIKFNKITDGGVISFYAQDRDGVEKKYSGCWNWANKTLSEFQDWHFTGYYSDIDSNGRCIGGIWEVTDDLDKGRSKEIKGSTAFSITLMMNK